MPSFWKTVLFGALGVLCFDTLGATASRILGFRYGLLTIGTYIIYTFVSYKAGRQAGMAAALTTGASLGLVDSTLGWAISWAIGPGRPSQVISTVAIAVTCVFVIGLGAVLGLVGGVLARAIGAGR